MLSTALEELGKVVDKGNVLIVGTKGQAAGIIESMAQEVGAFYITKRWPGGLFTNFDAIKGSVQTDTVHFWYLARKDMQTRHNTTIPFQSGERALVYGNRIADETRIVELLKPELSSRLEHLDSLFSGTTSEHRTRNIVDDSAVYASVASSTQVKTHFGIASSSGVVICGTERGMQTARSFLRDTLSFCCSQDQWSATTVSADEYIEILKERAKEMEQ